MTGYERFYLHYVKTQSTLVFLKIGQTSKGLAIIGMELSPTGILKKFVIEYQALASDY